MSTCADPNLNGSTFDINAEFKYIGEIKNDIESESKGSTESRAEAGPQL